MAKRVFNASSFTPTATADNSALTNATYMAIEAASATQLINILEIYEYGQAATSAVNIMQFARSLAFGITPTALSAPNGDGPMHTSTAALAAVPVTYIAAGTGPTRTNTAATARLNIGFNAAGGIVRWKPAPGEEFVILGTAVSVSGSTLSAFTGGNVGAMGAHLIYEPL